MRLLSARSYVALAVVCAAIVVAVVAWNLTHDDDQATVLDDVAGVGGWQTIDYHGTIVNIPDDWERQDRGDCEFAFEYWAPEGSPPCQNNVGVSFYMSATFDPASGTGVHRGGTDTDAAAWAGYAYGGDYAVYAASTDRDVVQVILDSVQ